MKYDVLGIQSVDYVSRKTGNPVKGVTLYVKYKDAQVQGEATANIFVSDNLRIPCIADVRPQSVVDVEYSPRGYVAGLSLVSAGK